MNTGFVKLLQIFTGVLILSAASFSMAATWDYDFDGDEDERGGQPLNFGDLDVYGYQSGSSAYAYLDAGYLSGLGVCEGPIDPGTTGTANKCKTPGSGPGTGADDDNLQLDEVLEFVFSVAKQVEVGINGPHTTANGHSVLIHSNVGGWDLLTVIAGKITLGLQHAGLTTLKIFGQGAFNDNVGRTSTDLYVAGINEVPIPAAAWLFGSALLGLAGLRRRKVAG